jgi:hypothetical protein
LLEADIQELLEKRDVLMQVRIDVYEARDCMPVRFG